MKRICATQMFIGDLKRCYITGRLDVATGRSRGKQNLQKNKKGISVITVIWLLSFNFPCIGHEERCS